MSLVRNITSIYEVDVNGSYVMITGSNGESKNTTCNEDGVVAYDYEGAMKFTIAVVMVYGVGIIGLLGIYSKKNRMAEEKNKEGDAFVRNLEQKRHIIERKSRKSAITKLVTNISGDILLSKSQNTTVGSLAFNPVMNIALPCNASIDPGIADGENTEGKSPPDRCPIQGSEHPGRKVAFSLDPETATKPDNNNSYKQEKLKSEGTSSVTYVCEDSNKGVRRNALKASLDTRPSMKEIPKIHNFMPIKHDNIVIQEEATPLTHGESFV